MSSYGLVDDERKQQIQDAHEEYQRQENTAATAAPVNQPIANNDAADDKAQTERCVVCPKCGERIWL